MSKVKTFGGAVKAAVVKLGADVIAPPPVAVTHAEDPPVAVKYSTSPSMLTMLTRKVVKGVESVAAARSVSSLQSASRLLLLRDRIYCMEPRE